MSEEIFEELIAPSMLERINKAYVKSDEYKQAIFKESEIYESLKKELTKEQRKKLEEYFIRTSETTAICEKLAYKQGMEDLVDVLGIDKKSRESL